MIYDKGNSYDFFAIVKDLEPPGTIFESKQWPFRFGSVDKQFETYHGINVRLRYFIRLVIVRGYSSNITKEVDFLVQNLYQPPDINNTLKMEVG